MVKYKLSKETSYLIILSGLFGAFVSKVIDFYSPFFMDFLLNWTTATADDVTMLILRSLVVIGFIVMSYYAASYIANNLNPEN